MRKRNEIDALEAMRAENPAPLPDVGDTLTEEALEDQLKWVLAAAEAGTRGSLDDEADTSGRDSSGGRDTSGARASAAAPTRHRRARRRTFAFGVGFACAAAVAVALLVGASAGNRGNSGGNGPSLATGPGGRPLYTEAAMHVAEANPRLLVTAPGWKVTRADSFQVDGGEIDFGDGRHELSVIWYPADLYMSYLHDRAHVSKPVVSTLLGLTATTVDYGDGADYATMLAPQGSVFVEIRGTLASQAEYEEVLHSLRKVSVDRWLGAMPAYVVKPTERTTAVRNALRHVPYPSTFDPAAIEREAGVLDRYQLGVKVSGEVSCDWLAQWVHAQATGNVASAEEAVDAMATSHHWPILRRLATEGDFPKVVWLYADEIAAGHLNQGPAGYLTETDGTKYAIGPAYVEGLDCKGQYKRRVN